MDNDIDAVFVPKRVSMETNCGTSVQDGWSIWWNSRCLVLWLSASQQKGRVSMILHGNHIFWWLAPFLTIATTDLNLCPVALQDYGKVPKYLSHIKKDQQCVQCHRSRSLICRLRVLYSCFTANLWKREVYHWLYHILFSWAFSYRVLHWMILWPDA